MQNFHWKNTAKEGEGICHGSINVIQMERRFRNLRRRKLTDVFISWGHSGGRKFSGLGIQDRGLFRGPDAENKLNAYLQTHFPTSPTLESPDAMRDYIVEQISEWNDEWQPKSLLDLFEGFLKRMPLDRLAHFLDMVLPQLSPMHTRWDDPRKTLLCCHFFRLERAGMGANVRLQFP